MRFAQDSAENNSIHAYRQGEIIVNERKISSSVIITTDLIIEWQPQDFAAITAEQLGQLADYRPEIVILGTGERQRFPPPHYTVGLLSQGIGVEVMDTQAACRTFNVLLAEGRSVLAALIMQ